MTKFNLMLTKVLATGTVGGLTMGVFVMALAFGSIFWLAVIIGISILVKIGIDTDDYVNKVRKEIKNGKFTDA